MKNFIYTFFAVFALLLSFTSCNSKVENDIKTLNNNNVKSITVREVKMDGERFWCFTNEFSEGSGQFDTDVANHMTDSIYALDLPLETRSKMSEEAIEKFFNDMENFSNDLKEKYKNGGTLYVARHDEKDKYGNWLKMPTYAVYVYNADGTLHQYKGNEENAIINSAWPEKREEELKAIGEGLKTMLGK